MELDELARERQSESGAFDLLARRGLLELLEDRLEVLRRYARSGVGNGNLDLALRAVMFGAVGTAGQRCTTTRRLLVQKPVVEIFVEKLIAAYRQVKIGNPLEDGVLMGPLIDADAMQTMQKALETAKRQGGEVVYGGKVLARD